MRKILISIQFSIEQIVYISISCKPSCADQKTAVISRIMVQKPHRRQGHGRRTLVWALKKLFDGGAHRIKIFSPSKKGLHCVYCNFQSSHITAILFYTRQIGFKYDAMKELSLNYFDLLTHELKRVPNVQRTESLSPFAATTDPSAGRFVVIVVTPKFSSSSYRKFEDQPPGLQRRGLRVRPRNRD